MRWLQRDNANLDLLRAMAVLCVVVFHILLLKQMLVFGSLNLHTLGTWGVLIFFVHTSLVLMLSLERQPAAWSPAEHCSAFFIRRCFRLLPLSVTVVLIVYWLRLPLDYSEQHFHDAGFTPALLLSNLLLIQDITHVESIESPLWSLPYEMHMYLCLPLLFYIVARSVTWWPAAALLVGSMVAAALASMAVRLPRQFPWFPWDLLNYVPCFLAGVVAFQLYRLRASRQPAQPDSPYAMLRSSNGPAPSSEGLPGLLWPVFVLGVTAAFLLTAPHGTRWISPRWLGCLIIGLGFPLFRPVKVQWLVLTSATIARYSYSIYLTHFFCLWFAFVKLAPSAPLIRWSCFLTLVVVLPLLFYHLLEKPMIQLGSRVVSQLLGHAATRVTVTGEFNTT